MADSVNVGVVGCGAISAAYFKMAPKLPILRMAACADLDLERAKARAAEFGVPKACTVEELIADPEIEIVLNLTVPKAHVPVALRALEHGKHTYAEKPLGVDRAEGERLLTAMRESGLRVGCAPDTFLGAGLQTARKVLDDGGIGRPVAFTGFMLGRGPEWFHLDPQFFFLPGGGPMFDMGPYYVTALLNLLGPIRRVQGAATIAVPERQVHKGPKEGERITVETPDHICGTLEFENGCLGTLITSFAIAVGDYDREFPITIYGTEGTLRVPDPNMFDGKVQVRRPGDEEWTDVPHAFPEGYGRSVGLADMAYAVRTGRPQRVSGENALVTLDVMQSFLETARSGSGYQPQFPYQRPAPMPADLPFGTLDE